MGRAGSRTPELRVRSRLRECRVSTRRQSCFAVPGLYSCRTLVALGVCGLGCPGSSLGQSAFSIVCGVPHQPIGRKAVTARGRKRTVHLTQCPFKVLGMAGELAPRAESSPRGLFSLTNPSVWLQTGWRQLEEGNIYYLSL